jgi:hypothetical protein
MWIVWISGKRKLLQVAAELIHTDKENTVVHTALVTYTILLMKIKGSVLEAERHGEAIMDVMTQKVSISDLVLFCNKSVIRHTESGQKYF